MFIDKHHIIPKFEGGTDDFNNLIKLPRNIHQEVHYRRWLVYGKIQDLYAYQVLGGTLSIEEQKKIYENQVFRYFRDKDKIESSRKKSKKWIESHQNEEYKNKKRQQSSNLNKSGKINSKKSRKLISEIKSKVPNYNSKKISVFGIVWDDASKCFKNGGSMGLSLRQLRYRAKSKKYQDIFYITNEKY